MQSATIQYLLDELPKLKKLFSERDSETLDFKTMVILAVIVDKLDTLIQAVDDMRYKY